MPHVHRLDIESAALRLEQGAQAKKKKGKGKAGASAAKGKISREAKVIPRLIYEIEQYERHLIQLAKTTKARRGALDLTRA